MNGEAGRAASGDYRVRLPVFEGPLGLLLFLIRRNEVDVYDIPIVEITRQYEQHLELMKELDLDVAGEFFEMAATLIRIKTRLLLPSEGGEGEEGEDPRRELVDQLLEYQRMREAAEVLRRLREEASAALPRPADADRPAPEEEVVFEADLYALVAAFHAILHRRRLERPLAVLPQRFTVEEKIAAIRGLLREGGSIAFLALFPEDAEREEVVTAFLALLEMVKNGEVRCYQRGLDAAIRIFPAGRNAGEEASG